MEIKTYAPVLIPTLNRYEHFKRCLESLEKCTGAEHTEIFVALDYPPSEKYKEGWSKICKYLEEKKQSHLFKELHVIKRDHNYGICKLNSNPGSARDEFIAPRFDCYITTEDDNEFSPNFLEYMNWGLSTYAKDPSVLAICGYSDLPTEIFKNNIYKFDRFCAWGCGMWFDKYEKVKHFYDFSVLEQHVTSIPFQVIFSYSDLLHAFHVLRMIKHKTFYGDAIRGCLPKEERNYIYPVISKVRNHGTDGSGQHGKVSSSRYEKYINLEIDSDSQFFPCIKTDLFVPESEVFFKKSQSYSFIRHLYFSFAFVLWRIFRINIS